MLAEPTKSWTLDDVLARMRAPHFEPGEGWRYSNTGFHLLGAVVEKVAASPMGDLIQACLLDSLDLDATWYGVEDPEAVDVAAAYIDPSGSGEPQPVSLLMPWTAFRSSAGPAGAVVATAGDAARFLHRLATGSVVTQESWLAHFWSESFGHIYPMLRRLRERGLVEQRVERQEGRPDRKVYAITDRGRAALEAWFAEPPSPARPRNEVLLRIFLGRHADPAHLIRDVRAQRVGFEQTLAQLRAVQERLDTDATDHPDRVYWELTLTYGLKALEALVEWGEEAESKLREPDGEGDLIP